MEMAYERYISDETMAVVMPVAAYWVASGFYELLACLQPEARLHSKADEYAKNKPSRWRVANLILFEQALEVALYGLYMKVTAGDNHGVPKEQPSIAVLALQFLAGMLIIETVQYFGHRYTHENKFVYKQFHSWHHAMIVPYATSALYSHPFDDIFVGIVGGVLAAELTGMTPRTAMYLFSLSNIKFVELHCGMWLPWSPFQLLFRNNPAFHDTHHQPSGQRHNFSQPFFLFWDKILGTYMPYEVVKRQGGGYQVRLLVD